MRSPRPHQYQNYMQFSGTCSDCGKKIYLYSKRCQPCWHKVRGKRQIGKNNPLWKGGKPKCVDCGKQLSAYGNKRCMPCRGKWTSKIKGGIHKLKKICAHCGKDFQTYCKTSYLCSVKCQKDYKVGENAANWRGGIENLPYSKEFNDATKLRIRTRDNFECQMCGCPERENMKALAIHHIDYEKMNGADENLISLCVHCHSITHGNRDHWTKTLSELVGRKYNESR